MATFIKVTTIHKNGTVLLDGELNLDSIDYFHKAATNTDKTRVYTKGGHELVVSINVDDLRSILETIKYKV